MGNLKAINWPIVVGCEQLTEGCDSCPSFKNAVEHYGIEGHIFEKGYDPYILEEQFSLPYSLKKQKIFHVALGSDIFHESITGDQLKLIFTVMNENPNHIFIVTSKRAERMYTATKRFKLTWSDNIVAAVSVESWEYKWRMDYLRQIECKHKSLSLVPLLGPMGILNLNGFESVCVEPETWENARPFSMTWALEVEKQCQEQKVEYYFNSTPDIWEDN